MALEAQILAEDPADTRTLLDLDGQRTGVRVATEVIERARVAKAAQAVIEAHASVESAKCGLEAARHALAVAEAPVNARRVEAHLARREPTKPHFAGPATIIHPGV